IRAQQPHDPSPRSPKAYLTNNTVTQAAPCLPRGIRQSCECNDRGPMLVVVQYRLGDPCAQLLLDLEALGRGYIPELDRPEGTLNGRAGPDPPSGARLVEKDGHSTETHEISKQGSLALHHGKTRERTNVAESEHRRAVGDNRHGVVKVREFVSSLRVLLD